jgi:GT2 family glycosyltransferase
MISYLLPTHDRPKVLCRTLAALGALDADAHDAFGGAEVIVIDNASSPPVQIGATNRLANGLPLRLIRSELNAGAAVRNVGAQAAQGEWIIMLDDDSYPLDAGHLDAFADADADVAAIGAEIRLPSGSREAGGLPEVIVGCGAAIRRNAFLAVGGYDPAFDYYAEEYDLCAKFIIEGWRIVHDQRFKVQHDKTEAGRDMNRILYRLVRNNCSAELPR